MANTKICLIVLTHFPLKASDQDTNSCYGNPCQVNALIIYPSY